MTSGTLSDEELQRLFDEKIAPVVFADPPSAGSPVMVLLVGQPGAAPLRAASELVRQTPDGMARVSAAELRAFHPQFLELSRSRSPEAPRLLATSAATWMQGALRHARTTRRSLLLDGARSAVETSLAAIGLFANSGFTTRVVVVATPRPESLLSTASKFLLDAKAGRSTPFTGVADHDTRFAETRELVAALEAKPSVDRVTVLDREGLMRFDAVRTNETSFVGAGRVLELEQSAPMSASKAMRWLSELRAMTDYTLSLRSIAEPLAEVLIELHELALREVLPELGLPQDSVARPTVEANIARQLAAIREATSVSRPPSPAPAPTPVIPAPQPDRGISI